MRDPGSTTACAKWSYLVNMARVTSAPPLQIKVVSPYFGSSRFRLPQVNIIKEMDLTLTAGKVNVSGLSLYGL